MHSDYRHDPFGDASTAMAITGEVQMIPAGSPYEIRLNEVPLKDTPSSIVLRVRDALSAAITTAGATSCTVINGAWFANDDVITIDSEQMLVTNVSGATLTVTRGHNGTTAVTHTLGTPVFGPVWSEVAATPAARQYWPDYGTSADSDANWNTGTVQFNSADAGKVVYINYSGTGSLGSINPARNYPSWMTEYGDGSDGHFISSGNVTLDGLKQYKSFVLQSGHTLTVGSNPLAIVCQGPVVIAGAISGVGSAGSTKQLAETVTAAGGAGKGGGGTGGTAIANESVYTATNGLQATGAAGGKGAVVPGATAGEGGIGYPLGAAVLAGASVAASLVALIARHFLPSAGAGGGGGARGKGGGGGGGSVELVAKRLVNTGTITLSGGAVGATNTQSMGGGGGGGASVRVVAPSVALTGTINVSGGAGGAGAAGITAADAGGAGWSATFEIGG